MYNLSVMDFEKRTESMSVLANATRNFTEKVRPERERKAKLYADIAKRIAIEFAKFVKKNVYSTNQSSIYGHAGRSWTREELFNEWIEKIYKP